ncbi:MAG: dienelactone hydrolase family protein [Planctomycetales bacterium]
MNSLLLLLLAATAQPGAEFEERAFVYSGGPYQNEEFKYRLLKPKTIEDGKTYPVVLFLHGAGERGTDNKRQLKYFPDQMSKTPWREKYPCFLVAPQCRPGKQWVDVPWGDKKSTPLRDHPTHQMKVAIGILEEVIQKNPADSTRVYLTGLSMGGYGSWDLAARRPDWFAAVAPICGGGDERQAAKLKDVPLWAFHGGADRVVPTVRSRQMIEALRAAGGKPKYDEFPGVGHNSWSRAYQNPEGCVPWMFQQTNAAAKPKNK